MALALSSSITAGRGQLDKGIELLEKSIAGDPVNPRRYRDLSLILYHAQMYREALEANRKMLDLNPEMSGSHLFVSEVLRAEGDPASALTESDREGDGDVREQCSCRVLAYDALGRKDEADAALAKMERSYANWDAYDIGRIHASRGDLDQAFDWLDRAYRQRDVDLLWVKVDPVLKNVQSDPRFLALLKKNGNV